MKNTLTLSFLAALGLTLLPCSECLAATPALGAPATQMDHVSLARELVASLDEMNAILASVTDKASADAAASKLELVVARMETISALADALGEPTPEAEQALAGVGSELNTKFGSLIEKLLLLDIKNFYGSTALETVLDKVE